MHPIESALNKKHVAKRPGSHCRQHRRKCLRVVCNAPKKRSHFFVSRRLLLEHLRRHLCPALPIMGVDGTLRS